MGPCDPRPSLGRCPAISHAAQIATRSASSASAIALAAAPRPTCDPTPPSTPCAVAVALAMNWASTRAAAPRLRLAPWGPMEACALTSTQTLTLAAAWSAAERSPSRFPARPSDAVDDALQRCRGVAGCGQQPTEQAAAGSARGRASPAERRREVRAGRRQGLDAGRRSDGSDELRAGGRRCVHGHLRRARRGEHLDDGVRHEARLDLRRRVDGREAQVVDLQRGVGRERRVQGRREVERHRGLGLDARGARTSRPPPERPRRGPLRAAPPRR